ncbi:MAG: aminotransferase class V-fold PLP-dependent enzyme [Bacillota bacterium]|nr:aminotransferase class V-fold PLP-dependent enzyme [Bacillota bacterium]
MIYLDNAATTWPKPPGVEKAMVETLREKGANPGRGGHQMSLAAGRVVNQTRELLARLFGARNPSRVVFTLNCTEALNLALKGFLKSGDHVLTSSMEHNSMIRPLRALTRAGVEYTVVPCSERGELDPDDLEKGIKSNTRLIALTHASNVTGTLLPIAEAGKIARHHGIAFLVDAAQTAGIFSIDVDELNIDLLAFPGHKGLYGPPGTGGLYIREGISLDPLKHGGTGSASNSEDQPDIMPEMYESGTVNTVGIAGLGAGAAFVLEEGLEKIRQREESLLVRLRAGLAAVPGLKIYGPQAGPQAPTLAVNLGNADSGEVAFLLDRVYQIAVRAGLHCAALAHRTLGTTKQGVVRFSLSYFNTEEEIETAIRAMEELARDLS